MSITFENRETALPLLRERLRDMSDAELLRYGKAAKGLCKDARCPETFKIQQREARDEWRSRHPRVQ